MNEDKNVAIIPEVVFRNGKTWKLVPGYLNTYANEDGIIMLLNSESNFIVPKTFEWKTTKGTYKYIKIINNDFVPVTKAIHQLICMTFNGAPPSDGRIYEPNHIDGNKHNNHPKNLEWMTRSKNIQHAYDNGLCQAGIRIKAINIITGEVQEFFSLSSMSRKWNIPRYLLRTIISEYRDKPYNNCWLFTVDDSNDKKLNRHQRLEVQFKDYVNDKIMIVNDSCEASILTGVKASTIISRINGKVKDAKSLLSRFVFKPANEISIWPNFSKEEAIQSENDYILNLNRIKLSKK